MAGPSGILLLLDDLHWADTQSLQLLRHLATAARPMRMVLVGTFRESEVGADSALANLLAGLHREANVTRLPLGGLGDTDVLACTRRVDGGDRRQPVLRGRVVAASG